MHPHLGRDCSRMEASSTARRTCPGAVACYGEGWIVQQASSEWETVTATAGFVETRQRRSELRGQTPVGANTIHSLQIQTSRRIGDG
uniref:Uncharacterized protein n=2 Tax=Cucumis melo TaxID=3656 RepID=A0A9I9EDT0_CUCME